MKIKEILLIILVVLIPVQAQDTEEVGDTTWFSGQSSMELRKEKDYEVLGKLSMLDLWVPFKFGVGGMVHLDPEWAFELEYLRGSLNINLIVEDIGRITDERFSLMARSFNKRNSFNFIYGAYYNSFKAQLNYRYLDEVAAAIDPNIVNLIDVKVAGVTWGVGNHWYLSDKVTFGVDWFLINIPIWKIKAEAPFTAYTSSESSKQDVQDTLDVFKNVPTMTFLKLQLGISF